MGRMSGMITRRGLLKGIGATALMGIATTAYAGWVEPMWMTRVKTYRFRPPNWSKAPNLRVALLADIHACRPWMPPERIRAIVDQTNALQPDIALLLGDYVQGTNLVRDHVPASEWGPELGRLVAPLGVHAVLGNHDWWEDGVAQRTGGGTPIAGQALQDAGVSLYQNRAARLEKDGKGFWLAGTDSMLALSPSKSSGRRRFGSLADIRRTLSQVDGDEAVIMMSHEPEIFARMPQRVSLTLSGHLHGGQVNILGWMPGIGSNHSRRYAYGHIVEDSRHLIVSGGLGMSVLPVRFGAPPEIVMLELGDYASA